MVLLRTDIKNSALFTKNKHRTPALSERGFGLRGKKRKEKIGEITKAA